MILADIFDMVDILDISFSEFRKIIDDNKAVRVDFDYDRLEHNVTNYKKYMESHIISIRSFCKEEGIDHKKFISFISRYGLDRKPDVLNKVRAAIAYKRSNKGMTYKAAAEKFGCNVNTVYSYVYKV